MCGGVYYSHDGEDKKVYFPNPYALLPVRMRDKSIELLAWGRRKEQLGNLPLGGWARLESINTGRWDKYFPKPVKIPVKSFMEKDHVGQSHWFDLTKGQCIQGLVARDKDESRLYDVTVTPEDPSAVHDRWPRIVSTID